MAWASPFTAVAGGTILAANSNQTRDNLNYLYASTLIPIGGIFLATVSTNPASLLGYGTWSAFAGGRTIIGVGTSDAVYAAAATGGETNHTLTTAELAVHTHTQNSHNHTQDAHNHSYRDRNNPTQQAQDSGPGQYFDKYDDPVVNYATSGNATATNQAATATNQNAGSGTAHNNLPPYVVAYIWTRTA